MREINEELASIIEARKSELTQSMILASDVNPFDLWSEKMGKGLERKYWNSTNHFMYLVESLRDSDPNLFVDYITWVEQLLKGLKFPSESLASMLQYTKKLLKDHVPSGMGHITDEYLDMAISKIGSDHKEHESFIRKDNPYRELATDYLEALLRGDRATASRQILDAASNGMNVRNIYLDVFQPCQYEIGRLWHLNIVTVAQEHFCSAATQLIMSQLYPYIFATEKRGRAFIGTCVGGELHEMGVRMVADFFEMDGWDTYYLGANTPADTIVEAVRKYDADVLGLSVSMSYHISVLKDLVSAIRHECQSHKVKIMVGGYIINNIPGVWKKIGADASAPDALGAISVANGLLEG